MKSRPGKVNKAMSDTVQCIVALIRWFRYMSSLLREELRKWGHDSPFQYLRAFWEGSGEELAPVISAPEFTALKTTAQTGKGMKDTCTHYLSISPCCTRDNGTERERNERYLHPLSQHQSLLHSRQWHSERERNRRCLHQLSQHQSSLHSRQRHREGKK